MAVSLINSIEANCQRHSKSLSIATKAMEEAHNDLYDLIHYVQKSSDRAFLTQGEHVFIDQLRSIAKILNDAAVSIRDELKDV